VAQSNSGDACPVEAPPDVTTRYQVMKQVFGLALFGSKLGCTDCKPLAACKSFSVLDDACFLQPNALTTRFVDVAVFFEMGAGAVAEL
jgi:hypothetical protein